MAYGVHTYVHCPKMSLLFLAIQGPILVFEKNVTEKESNQRLLYFPHLI